MNQLHAESNGKRRPKTKKKIYSSSIYSTLGVSRFKSKAFHTWEEEKNTTHIQLEFRCDFPLFVALSNLSFYFFYFFLLIFYVFFKFDCKVNIGKPNQSRFVRWICLCSCVHRKVFVLNRTYYTEREKKIYIYTNGYHRVFSVLFYSPQLDCLSVSVIFIR